MAGSGSSFVDEIYDQFLMCRMCSETYKSPKVLTCMHTFCEKCLETHYEMEEQERPYRFLLYTRALTCPLCHSRTELPTGGVHRLPDNFLVANLSEVVSRRKPSPKNSVCEICRPGPLVNEADRDGETEKRAVSKCLDCVKLLCRSCTELHRKTRVTQHHGLFDVQVERDAECKLHQNEVLRFYCEPCEECICVLCTFLDHKDHEVSSLVEALDRHRGPFETLMDRCRGRIEGLREQVELIDRCERGLKLAEEHIRDSAIESIAAIRKREKDLLMELRETLGEQSLDFIGEKNTFKENLKNLEGTFNLTNSMLKGTKIDLLIVKKEMEKKLMAILDSGVKKTPDSLKSNIRFCDADFYQDVRKSAFDQMVKTDRFVCRTADRPEPKRPVQVQSVGTETESTPSSEPEDAKDDDVMDESEIPEMDSRRNSTWQRPMAVVTVTEIPRTFGTVTLRPVRGLPRNRDAVTQTTRVVTVEDSTEMPVVTVLEKETNTPSVHVVQKGVSTDNQSMVDKSTSTVLVDVTAAYRGAAATVKRSVMVSRGTCTPRMMTVDKETLSVPNSMSTRGCSPIVWINGSTASEEDSTSGLSIATVEKIEGNDSEKNPLTQSSSKDPVGLATKELPVNTTVASGPVREVSTDATRKIQTQQMGGEVKPPGQSMPVAQSSSMPIGVPIQNSLTTQAKPCQGQGSVGGGPGEKIVVQNPANPAKQDPFQVGQVLNQELVPTSKSQLTAESQGPQVPNKSPGLAALFGFQAISGAQGGSQVRSQGPTPVPGPQSVPVNQGSQVRFQGITSVPGPQSVPGNLVGQVCMQGPLTVSVPQTISGNQGGQVRIHGITAVPGSQSVPGSQGGQVRMQGITSIPGPQPILTAQGGLIRNQEPTTVPIPQSLSGNQGGQIRIQGPSTVPVPQSIPGNQGGQVRIQGPSTVPVPQSIPGNQGGQVRNQGPVSVPQSIPGIQGGQVRIQGPIGVYGIQTIPGTQRGQMPTTVPGVHSLPVDQGQVRSIGPVSVPGTQSLPGTQGAQMRTICPANVPGTPSLPGTQGGQIITQAIPGPMTVQNVVGSTATVGSGANNPPVGMQVGQTSTSASASKAVSSNQTLPMNNPFKPSAPSFSQDHTTVKANSPQEATKTENQLQKSPSNPPTTHQIQSNSGANILPRNTPTTAPETPKTPQTTAENSAPAQVVQTSNSQGHQNPLSQATIVNQNTVRNIATTTSTHINVEPKNSTLAPNTTAATSVLSRNNCPNEASRNFAPSPSPMAVFRTPAPTQILEAILGSRAPTKSNATSPNANQKSPEGFINGGPSVTNGGQIMSQTGSPGPIGVQNRLPNQPMNVPSTRMVSNSPNSVPMQRPIGPVPGATQDPPRASIGSGSDQPPVVPVTPNLRQDNAMISGRQTSAPANASFPEPPGNIPGKTAVVNHSTTPVSSSKPTENPQNAATLASVPTANAQMTATM